MHVRSFVSTDVHLGANTILPFEEGGISIENTLFKCLWGLRPEILEQSEIQRTLDAQAFGVQVTHGGFQRLVSHGLLDGARVGPSFQAMRGVPVA